MKDDCPSSDVRDGQLVSQALPVPDAVGRERVQQPQVFILRQLTQLHAGPSHAERHPVQQHSSIPQHAATSHGPPPGHVQPAE